MSGDEVVPFVRQRGYNCPDRSIRKKKLLEPFLKKVGQSLFSDILVLILRKVKIGWVMFTTT